jgi:hypothetical protein
MKNIHVLPTPNPSRLVKQKYDEIDRLCLADIATKRAEYKRFNLYITSDEEIKEGDWFITKGEVFKCTLSDEFIWRNNFDKFPCLKIDCKKIILTTDPLLIADGVQAIDDEFLEWFIKNPSCEEVEVFHQDVYSMGKWDRRYKIIIPKEKPKQDKIMERFIANAKQQETLEEAAENFWLNDDAMTDNDRISM